jgi:hypothetical protein
VGPKGPIGPSPQGAKGPQGTSLKGLKGNIGPSPSGGPGPQGPPGNKGPTGPAGTQGAKGPIGNSSFGLPGAPGPANQGPKGPVGPVGPKGNIGAQGDKGVKGLPCYGTFMLQQSNVDCVEACGYSELSEYYSDCSTLSGGCLLWSTSYGCYNCDGPGIGSDYLSDGTNCWFWQSDCSLTPISTCDKSDIFLKRGIQTLTNPLENIMKMESVEFDWNEKSPIYQQKLKNNKLHDIGFIAQQVNSIYPQLIISDKDSNLYVKYSQINAILIEGVKEQQRKIETINSDLEYLSNIL